MLKLITLLYRFVFFIQCIGEGILLGLFSRKKIYRKSNAFFEKQKFYYSVEHNTRGLFLWEKYAIEKYFIPKSNLLLLAAGCGREVYSLEKLGFEITAYECNQKMVDYANNFLAKENLISRIAHSEADTCPLHFVKFKQGIISWAAYSHIKGKNKRIDFLKAINASLSDNAPLLISFWVMSSNKFYHRLIVRIARMFRKDKVENIEMGDRFPGHFTHSFTKEELNEEITSAGFEMIYYETEAYGHAVVLKKM